MPECKAKPIGKVKGLGEIFEVSAPLHEQILAFEDEGIQYPFLVTPEEVCMTRIAEVSDDGTRTCIALVVVKGEKPILYKPSPFMNAEMARIAVAYHFEGEYPTLPREFYEGVKERAKKQLSLAPEDRTAHVLQSTEDYDLTPKMDDTKVILGKPATEYFSKFKLSSIPLTNLSAEGLSEDKCRVNYLRFYSVDAGSELGFRNQLLYYSNKALAVLKGKGVPETKKSLLGKLGE